MMDTIKALAEMLGVDPDEAEAVLAKHLDLVAETLAGVMDAEAEGEEDPMADEAAQQAGLRRAMRNSFRRRHSEKWIEDKIKADCVRRGVPYLAPHECDSITSEMRHRRIVRAARRR